MGQLPKSRIEQLKREKREDKAAKKRKVATREKIVRFLVVCEGERTEPNYLRGLVRDRYPEVRSEVQVQRQHIPKNLFRFFEKKS